MSREFTQDPLDKRQVVIDFTPWLDGSAITAAAWVVPVDLTASDETFTSTAAFNYFAGGTEDTEYEVACTITTNESVPRQKTQRFILKIEKFFD